MVPRFMKSKRSKINDLQFRSYDDTVKFFRTIASLNGVSYICTQYDAHLI